MCSDGPPATGTWLGRRLPRRELGREAAPRRRPEYSTVARCVQKAGLFVTKINKRKQINVLLHMSLGHYRESSNVVEFI